MGLLATIGTNLRLIALELAARVVICLGGRFLMAIWRRLWRWWVQRRVAENETDLPV